MTTRAAVPFGSISANPRELAATIWRRLRARSADGVYLVWSEHGEVFAQPILARAAQRIECDKPGAIVGLYTQRASYQDIADDLETMQLELMA